jgi:hypothetical protein
MALKVVQFFAVILTALALVPAGAHFFELPNKIDLAQEYSHAASAMITFVALCSLTLSILWARG